MHKLIQILLHSYFSSSCPDVQPIEKFNTTEYIRSTWYIQQQQITGYQPEDTLYCVAQTLNETHTHVPFYNGYVLKAELFTPKLTEYWSKNWRLVAIAT